MKIALVLLSFITFKALGCEVTLPSKIYLLKEDNFKSYIKTSKCSSDTISKIHNTILNSEGTISSRNLNRISNTKAKISPSKISVFKIESYVKEKLNLRNDLFITEIRLNNLQGPLTANKEESLSIKCHNCNRIGSFGSNIILRSPFSKKTHWAQIKIKRQIEVLTLRDDIRFANKELTPSMFKKSFILTNYPSKFLNNKEELIFYKNNKPLTKGHALQTIDITPLQLVKRGEKTHVLIKSNKMTMNGYGLPLRSGKIGQNIELRNTKSNKTFSAKVIGKNKVMIEL